MFQGTIDKATEPMRIEGQLPFDLSFPFLTELLGKTVPTTPVVNIPIESQNEIAGLYERMYDELSQAYSFAKFAFEDIENSQLDRAYMEAKLLASSRLFEDQLLPEISVDPYGEFIFSHRSDAGYVDIGVSGDGELSYHVRNDVDPDKTAFEDHDWVDYHVPSRLLAALAELRKHL